MSCTLENTESADQKRQQARQQARQQKHQQKQQQKLQAIVQLIAAQANILGTQGAVVQTWRTYAGTRLGPYFSLIFRQEGRQRSLYLGADSKFADEVRELLEQVQGPLRERRAAKRRRASTERELRRCKSAWDAELHPYGLRLQGWEVRGWRTARATATFAELTEVTEAGVLGPLNSGSMVSKIGDAS